MSSSRLQCVCSAAGDLGDGVSRGPGFVAPKTGRTFFAGVEVVFGEYLTFRGAWSPWLPWERLLWGRLVGLIMCLLLGRSWCWNSTSPKKLE